MVSKGRNHITTATTDLFILPYNQTKSIKKNNQIFKVTMVYIHPRLASISRNQHFPLCIKPGEGAWMLPLGKVSLRLMTT